MPSIIYFQRHQVGLLTDNMQNLKLGFKVFTVYVVQSPSSVVIYNITHVHLDKCRTGSLIFFRPPFLVGSRSIINLFSTMTKQ